MSDNNFIKLGSWERQILTVYQEDDYLFVSDSLWKPYGNKGAFGGQLFSQGIHAMMLTVENDFLLTSCHSHYILSADTTKRIEYKVSKIRNGTVHIADFIRCYVLHKKCCCFSGRKNCIYCIWNFQEN